MTSVSFAQVSNHHHQSVPSSNISGVGSISDTLHDGESVTNTSGTAFDHRGDESSPGELFSSGLILHK